MGAQKPTAQRLSPWLPTARALGHAGSIGRVSSATTWENALGQAVCSTCCVARV